MEDIIKNIDEFIIENDQIESRKKFFGTRYTYKATGSAMKRKQVYVAPEDAELCRNCIDRRDFGKAADWHIAGSSNCRLDVLMSRDGSAAVIQMSRYVPYTYEPCTQPVLITGSEAGNVIKVLKG